MTTATQRSPVWRKPRAQSHPSPYWLATELAGGGAWLAAPYAVAEAINKSSASVREMFKAPTVRPHAANICAFPNKYSTHDAEPPPAQHLLQLDSAHGLDEISLEPGRTRIFACRM